MKFALTRTSNWIDDSIEYIEISTLDEMLGLIAKHDHPLVISPNKPEHVGSGYGEVDYVIEIYDDYRE